MERNISQFTVLFQPPFWVGIAERWSQDGYQAAWVVFGSGAHRRPAVPVAPERVAPAALWPCFTRDSPPVGLG